MSNNPPPQNLGVTLPGQARHLRACMLCSIILPTTQFNRDGCPNCEAVLSLQGNSDGINECTSSNFNGTIALTQPEGSWVAKWMRLEGYVQGIYAVQVMGELPEWATDNCADAGVRVVARDGRKEDGVQED
ncbi:putative transcriptional elongation protein Spt4 [Tothia fuscella]|uniref:Transcription elongation factor SPT4 n=1 Tax=Tothia fuscella TaxID=1048955 RepID=A0A9P4NMB2_9PEZI|nr:putative transcriptional elongation protein Spt4 [Tothia fuscella]